MLAVSNTSPISNLASLREKRALLPLGLDGSENRWRRRRVSGCVKIITSSSVLKSARRDIFPGWEDHDERAPRWADRREGEADSGVARIGVSHACRDAPWRWPAAVL